MPGLRFSLLLTRSTQFPSFGQILYGKYPDPVEQALGDHPAEERGVGPPGRHLLVRGEQLEQPPDRLLGR